MLLKEFTRDLKQEHYASDLAKKLKLNQKTVSNHLHALEKQHILRSRTVGKNLLFSFDFRNKDAVINFIISLEAQKSIDFLKKHHKIRSILEDINADNMIIFGSYAKGNQRSSSDLDILIIGNHDQEKVRKLSDMYEIEINVHSFSEKSLPKAFGKNNYLMNEIVKDHIIVRGFDLSIRSFMKYHYLI